MSAVVLLLGSAAVGAFAQNACIDIERESGKPLVDRELYLRVQGDRNREPIKWTRVADSSVPSFFITKGEAPRERKVTLAYVVWPTEARSGMLSISTRTHAIGTDKDAKDTPEIHLQRSQLREPCGLAGRTINYPNYDKRIHSRIYDDYHNPDAIGWSPELDRFHVRYKLDAGKCARTNGDEARRRAFRFGAIPTGSGFESIRAPDTPASVDSRTAGLFQVITSAIASLSGEPATKGSTATSPRQTYYSQLSNQLRRYHAKDGNAQCVTFDLRAERFETTTHVSVTDFDSDRSRASYIPTTWAIEWK